MKFHYHFLFAIVGLPLSAISAYALFLSVSLDPSTTHNQPLVMLAAPEAASPTPSATLAGTTATATGNASTPSPTSTRIISATPTIVATATEDPTPDAPVTGNFLSPRPFQVTLKWDESIRLGNDATITLEILPELEAPKGVASEPGLVVEVQFLDSGSRTPSGLATAKGAEFELYSLTAHLLLAPGGMKEIRGSSTYRVNDLNTTVAWSWFVQWEETGTKRFDVWVDATWIRKGEGTSQEMLTELVWTSGEGSFAKKTTVNSKLPFWQEKIGDIGGIVAGLLSSFTTFTITLVGKFRNPQMKGRTLS